MTRESWTDERLDDLNHKVDRGFEQVDRRFEHVDHRFDRVDGQIRELRKEMNTRLESLEGRFAALNRTLVTSVWGLAIALIASRAIPL